MSKDGGPAFPDIVTDLDYDTASQQRYPNTYSHGGMSLRDYFAAAAMQGILAGRTSWPETEQEMKEGAHAAYEVADAMLSERSGDSHE